MTIKEFCNDLETLLCFENFRDDISLNGLQTGDGDGKVNKVVFAVDACQASIDEAVRQHADLLVVHHGLFWGKPLAVTGSHYRRIKTMLDGGLSLFACHLPLDAHPVLGNNAQMAKFLNLTEIEDFSVFRGMKVGFKGRLPEKLSAEQIIEKLGIRESACNVVIGGGKKLNETVAIVSGGAAQDVREAINDGIDIFITGESSHAVYHDCLENRINMLCLGHYETETFGVKALSEYVKKTYGFETDFIDIPTFL